MCPTCPLADWVSTVSVWYVALNRIKSPVKHRTSLCNGRRPATEITPQFLMSVLPKRHLWALPKHPEIKDKEHINKVRGCSPFSIIAEMCSPSWLYWFQLEQNNSRFLRSCRILDEVRLSDAVREENDLNWDLLKNHLISCGLVCNHGSSTVLNGSS